MPVIKTTGLQTFDDRIDGYTNEQLVLILPKNKKTVGALLTAEFSTEHLYDEPDHDYLGLNYSLIGEVHKTNHSFIILDINNQNPESFIDPKELLNISEFNKNNMNVVYELPFDPDHDNQLSEIAESGDIQAVLSWFKSGAFDVVFKEVCKKLKKDPAKLIHTK